MIRPPDSNLDPFDIESDALDRIMQAYAREPSPDDLISEWRGLVDEAPLPLFRWGGLE